MTLKTFAPFSLSLVLAACAVGEDYRAPQTLLPEGWNAPTVSSTPRIVKAKDDFPVWWQTLGDPVLSELILNGLANNRSYQIALARLEEARADRSGIRSQLLPQINASGQAQRANQGMITNRKPVTLYEAGFDAAWEMDFFGQTQRQLEAATANEKAQNARLEDISLSIVSEIARNYSDFQSATQRAAILQRHLESQRDLFGLIEIRYRAGLINAAEVAQADAKLHTLEAEIPRAQAEARSSANRLCSLLGLPPGSLDATLANAQTMRLIQPEIALDTPARVITMRPDIQTSEHELASATALSAAAFAELFPKLSLSAFFGKQNTSIAPSQTVWSSGAQALMPLLNFGAIQSQIDAADARKQQALLRYQQAISDALEQVDSSLNAYLGADQRAQSLQEALANTITRTQLVQERYQKGLDAYTAVLTAQQESYQTELAANDAIHDAASRFIALHKALASPIWPKGQSF